MKPFLSKYLFPLAALAALIAYLLCYFEGKRCTDPITTYEVGPNGVVIEPDSTIAGITQIKVKVTTLDSLGATLLDTIVVPGAKLFVPVPSGVPAVQVRQQYLTGDVVTLTETENLRTSIIVGVDVIIRPITDFSDYADEFGDCCTPESGTLFHTGQLTAGSYHTFNWDGFITPAVNVMKITVNGGGTSVTFIVIYDTSITGSKPMIFGPCPTGDGTGFSGCDNNMTTMYTSGSLNFSIRFFKINGTDMEVEILPRNDGSISAYSCTNVG